jgi:hypothetical protein
VVTSDFAAAHVAAVRARIATAYQNIRTAMRRAGYADSAWTLMVQDYESPVPSGAGFRYAQSGYTRQDTGGCGFWNADADWANNTALPTIDRTVFGATADSGLSNVRTLEVRYSGWEAPRCWNGGSPAAGRAPRAASDCSAASPA